MAFAFCRKNGVFLHTSIVPAMQVLVAGDFGRDGAAAGGAGLTALALYGLITRFPPAV